MTTENTAPTSENFPAGTLEPEYTLTEALGTDEAGVFTDVSDEDRAHWMRARSFVQEDVLPVIARYWDESEYNLDLVTRMGELDLLRDGVAVPGMDN
ncbi:acyl-CoA dehydrogenase family protein, partial [Streptomyces sp. tea 10]|nr:acyl-CoA dehydrogenase family protein [Streptomyces sp. tea 10]